MNPRLPDDLPPADPDPVSTRAYPVGCVVCLLATLALSGLRPGPWFGVSP